MMPFICGVFLSALVLVLLSKLLDIRFLSKPLGFFVGYTFQQKTNLFWALLKTVSFNRSFFPFSFLEDVLCHEFASLALSSMAGRLCGKLL